MRSLQCIHNRMRQAIRRLRHDPGLIVLVTLTLALGVGVNSAIFSLVNGLHRPLPVQHPERLVVLATRHHGGSAGVEGMQYRFTYPALADFRTQATSYSSLLAFELGHGGLSTGGQSREFLFSYVSGNYFQALGIKPALGRLFADGEGEAPGSGISLVLGYSYWRERFAGDPAVVGSQVRINGVAATIVGVVGQRFQGTYANVDLNGFVPLSYLERAGNWGEGGFFHDRATPRLTVMGTLKPGVSRAAAQREAQVIASRLERQYPATDKGISVEVLPETWARPAPIPAMVATAPLIAALFLVLGGLVLALACMNVTNLLLVRAAAREREMAVRAALGSGRLRLLGQVLAESVLLAILGGAAGMLLSAWATDALAAMPLALGNMKVRLGFGFDWRVFTDSIAATLLAGIAAGLWPALAASRADIASTLHECGRSASAAPGSRRVRNLLVVAQVAGSLMLLIVAGCFAGGLAKARTASVGFDPRNLGIFTLDTAYAGYGRERSVAFFRELHRRVRDLPGVTSACLAHSVPMNYMQDGDAIEVEGQPATPGRQRPVVMFNAVTPEYFGTLRIDLHRGRAFHDSDQEETPPVAIINEVMAQRLWPNQDPVGKRFRIGRTGQRWWEVVGVAAGGKYFALFEPPLPFFYVPATQMYYSRRTLEVRSPLPAAVLLERVGREIRALDPEMPVSETGLLEESLEGVTGYWGYRLGAYLSGAMGLIGFALAIIGVYGLVSYTARQRTAEIGIRMALGAEARHVIRLVLGRGAVLVACGVAGGIAGASLLAALMSRALPGTLQAEPVLFLGASLFLAVVALAASYLPAYRATRLDPATALRHE
jgi:predicted permease